MPKECRPFVPFPTRCLPQPLACVVEEGAAALGCDESFVALPCLAVVAGAIGNSRSIMLKSSWYEPPIVWSAVIGESGTLKTPALKYALAPVHAAQRKFREEFARALARYESEHADTPKVDRPPRPALRRAHCSDTRVERLVQILEDCPKGVLVARDELSGWVGSFQKYKAKGAGSDLPNWLELYSAGVITVDRKTGVRTHVSVEHASASVTGGIQPKVMARALGGEHFDSGLVARLLLAWPPRRAKAWTEAEVPQETAEAYEDLVLKLHGLTMRQKSEGRFVPHRRRLSAGAKDAWVAFYTGFATEQEQAEGHVAAALSKLEGYAARFALIHHVVTMAGLGCDDDREVAECSVKAGVALARWFASEARRVYAALRESDVERDTRKLIDWVRSWGPAGATARDLRRSSPARYRTTEDAEADLDAMAKAGLGRWVWSAPGEQGGRPTRRFKFTIDETDEPPLPREGE